MVAKNNIIPKDLVSSHRTVNNSFARGGVISYYPRDSMSGYFVVDPAVHATLLWDNVRHKQNNHTFTSYNTKLHRGALVHQPFGSITAYFGRSYAQCVY